LIDCVGQQHHENKKLKRQSQRLLEKLGGVEMTLPDLLPELTEVEPSDELIQSQTDDASSSRHSAFVSKIQR